VWLGVRLERQAAGRWQRRVGRGRSAIRRWRRRRAAAMRPRPPTRVIQNRRALTLGHPEKFIDFAYRSEHEMTVAAKAVVNALRQRAEVSRTGMGARPAVARVWPKCSATRTTSMA
jgi:hypothetical protein